MMVLDTLSDTELIALLKEGDHAAFKEVYKRYNQLLYVFAYRKLKNREESKDVVQEVFIKVFRNIGSFHEDCTLSVAKRIQDAIKPKFIRIAGFWYPRGGMPIDVFWQSGKIPNGVWLPDPGVQNYRGRG